MSVATKNPFALLDSEDPSRPSTPAPAPAPAPASQETPQVPSTAAPQPSQKSKGGPASRGGRYYPRGGGTNKAAREQNADDTAPPAADAPPKKFDNEGQNRGRGRGRGRGGPRGSGRGRQYDRHSGTGKTDSDKKVHQSWGGDDGNAELKVEEAATNDAAVEGANDWAGTANWDTPTVSNDWGVDDAATNGDSWGQPAPTVDADAAPASPTGPDAEKTARDREGRKGREPEEEDNTLTLDQYLAQKKDSDVVPKLEGTRKANDGAEDIWKDAIPLKKEEQQDAYFVGKVKTAVKPRHKKEEKVYLEIDARFERPPRGGRGGRGGDRGDRPRGGGRGRGGPRGGRPNGNVTSVNVDDESAFPSLS